MFPTVRCAACPFGTAVHCSMRAAVVVVTTELHSSVCLSVSTLLCVGSLWLLYCLRQICLSDSLFCLWVCVYISFHVEGTFIPRLGPQAIVCQTKHCLYLRAVQSVSVKSRNKIDNKSLLDSQKQDSGELSAKMGQAVFFLFFFFCPYLSLFGAYQLHEVSSISVLILHKDAAQGVQRY